VWGEGGGWGGVYRCVGYACTCMSECVSMSHVCVTERERERVSEK